MNGRVVITWLDGTRSTAADRVAVLEAKIARLEARLTDANELLASSKKHMIEQNDLLHRIMDDMQRITHL